MDRVQAPSAQTVFRVAAIAAVATVGIADVIGYAVAGPGVLKADPTLPPHILRIAWLVLLAIMSGITIALGVMFWLNTRRGPALRTERRHAILLAIQMALAIVSNTDYLFVVAAQIPFVMRVRAAFLWLGAMMLMVCGVVIVDRNQTFEPVPSLATAPLAVRLPVTVAYVLMWQGFAFAAGYLASHEVRARAELERRNRELLATQDLLADSSRLAERAHLSRELHDTLGHHLAVLNVNLEAARHMSTGKTHEIVGEAQSVARLMLTDVRDVVSSLRATQPIDLAKGLATLAEGATAPAVHVTIGEGCAHLDPARAHALFRCAQEAITNAVRHASARHVWIDLRRTESGVILSARDDGRGTAALVPGHGMTGMRERVQAVGGSVETTTAPGHGFEVRVWVPTTASAAI